MNKSWENYKADNPTAVYEYCYCIPGPPRKIIDATAEDCDLHPLIQCPGRLINHGERSANLKAKDVILRHLEPPQRVLLLKASRQIEPFEPLLFNYGDNRACRELFGRS